MENEYILAIISAIAFVSGIVVGIQTVRFFSHELIYKLGNALESQIELNKDYLTNTMKHIIAVVEKKIDFIEQINEVLKKTTTYLIDNRQKIELLNQNCDKREELEFEIIKLKKIIQRLEKKR